MLKGGRKQDATPPWMSVRILTKHTHGQWKQAEKLGNWPGETESILAPTVCQQYN